MTSNEPVEEKMLPTGCASEDVHFKPTGSITLPVQPREERPCAAQLYYEMHSRDCMTSGENPPMSFIPVSNVKMEAIVEDLEHNIRYGLREFTTAIGLLFLPFVILISELIRILITRVVRPVVSQMLLIFIVIWEFITDCCLCCTRGCHRGCLPMVDMVGHFVKRCMVCDLNVRLHHYNSDSPAASEFIEAGDHWKRKLRDYTVRVV